MDTDVTFPASRTTPLCNTSSDTVNAYTWDAESQLRSRRTPPIFTRATEGASRKPTRSCLWFPNKFYCLALAARFSRKPTGAGTLQNEYVFSAASASRSFLPPVIPLITSKTFSHLARPHHNTGTYATTPILSVWRERSYTSTCAQNYKFEGKERDTENGNRRFGARYYSTASALAQRRLVQRTGAAPTQPLQPPNPQPLSMVADDQNPTQTSTDIAS